MNRPAAQSPGFRLWLKTQPASPCLITEQNRLPEPGFLHLLFKHHLKETDSLSIGPKADVKSHPKREWGNATESQNPGILLSRCVAMHGKLALANSWWGRVEQPPVDRGLDKASPEQLALPAIWLKRFVRQLLLPGTGCAPGDK